MYRILLLSLNILLTLQNFAQSSLPIITKYTVEDGLSHNQINWVYQDSRGLVWVGAANGINRFDGTQFNLVAKYDFIPTDNRYLFEDPEGDIWIQPSLKNENAIFFNTHKEELKSFDDKFGDQLSFKEKDIFSGAMLSDEIVLIGLKGGRVIYFDLNSKKIVKTIDTNLSCFRIIVSKHNKGFWLIDKRGVHTNRSTEIYFVEKNDTIKHLLTLPRLWHYEFGYNQLDELLVKTSSSIYKISPDGIVQEEQRLILDTTNNILSIKHPYYNPVFFRFMQNDYWLVRKSGVYRCGLNTEKGFEKIVEDKILNVSKFYNAYISEDFFWLGSIDGLFKINLKQPFPFKKLLYKNPNAHAQNEFYSCRGINSDSKGNVFISSQRNSLYKIKDTSIVEIEKGRKAIKSVILDDEGNLWFSAESNIFKKELSSNAAYEVKISKDINNKIWSLFFDKDKGLWIGGNTVLIYAEYGSEKKQNFNTGNGLVDFASEGITTYSFYQDQQKRLWALTSKGVLLLDAKKGILARYSSNRDKKHFLPAMDFRHMHQDRAGVFWLATKEGLVMWDEKNKATKLFNSGIGFSHNQLYAVYEDDYGFLWMSSDNGIIQFEKSTFKRRAYFPSDGITHREFNRISHHKANDGTIYFGGLNGVTYFHPKDFYKSFDQKLEIEMIMTGSRFFAHKSGKQEDCLEAFFQNGKILMNPNDKGLQVEFALLDYENSKEIQYAYAINPENLDEESGWNITKNNKLNIASLPYGKHLLVIKGKTANGVYSSKVLNISIEVEKPFYMKLWFLVSTGVGLLILVFGFQNYKTAQLKRKQKELEEAVASRTATIQAQKEALQSLDKAKSKFLANISHEFRTPLTLIMSTLSEENTAGFIEEYGKPKLRYFYEKDIQIVQRNTNRLHRLIEQLLDLTKLESGQLSLSASKQNFLIYLENLVNAFKLIAQQKSVELNFDVNTDHVDLYFDRDKMDKIFYNLISNAIKFTPEGGSVLVDLQLSGQQVFVNIIDTGIGIPDKDQPFVFDRFYQVKRNDEYSFEGTGLGLAMAKEMILLHHGVIEVESKPDKGTCFRLMLKTGKSHLKPEEIVAPLYTDVTKPFTKSSKHGTAKDSVEVEVLNSDEKPILLIIEDNKDLVNHLKHQLKSDYQLLSAYDGAEGVLKAVEKIPDLIICDVMMPKKNGYEVCNELKQNQLTDHIPFIMLTAKAAQQEKIKGLRYGADSYLVKPYDSKELKLIVHNHLQQSRNLQNKFQIDQNPQTDLHPFVKKFFDVLNENISNSNFGVEEIAGLLRMSRSQLFRKLKVITGDTPAILIRKHRLAKACELLKSYENNASEVAYMVGFSSPNYFYKCFKKEYGLTPSEFMSHTA